MQINREKTVQKLVNKTITSTKAEKNSSAEQSVHPLPLNSKSNAPSPNRIDWAPITTFTGAVISYNFGSCL